MMPALAGRAMTERQYRQLLNNHGRPWDRPLGECGVDGLLRDAARELRARERADAAWMDVLPDELRGLGGVVSLREGVLLIRARDGAALQKLQRRAAALTTALKRRVPGLERVSVTLGSENDESGDDVGTVE